MIRVVLAIRLLETETASLKQIDQTSISLETATVTRYFPNTLPNSTVDGVTWECRMGGFRRGGFAIAGKPHFICEEICHCTGFLLVFDTSLAIATSIKANLVIKAFSAHFFLKEQTAKCTEKGLDYQMVPQLGGLLNYCENPPSKHAIRISRVTARRLRRTICDQWRHLQTPERQNN